MTLKLFQPHIETFFSETKKSFRIKRFRISKQIFPKQKNVSNFFVSKRPINLFLQKQNTLEIYGDFDLHLAEK